MKKTAILLILVMMISLLPALNVSAAGEYSLKGLSQDEFVIIQREPEKTVTLVNAATGANATGVSKVAFTFNDNPTETVHGSIFSYIMEFDSIGTQTLKYDVFKTGNNTNVPDESETITFTTVSGKLNEESFSENFENIANADLAKRFVANNGANISGRLSLSVTDWKGSKALTIDGDKSNKAAYMQFRGAPSTTGYKVHYYEFDMTMSTSMHRKLYITADGYTTVTNAHELFTNKKTDTGIGTNSQLDSTTVAHIELILDYNQTPPVATIYKGGALWQTISLSNLANGTQDPVVTLYFQTHSSGHPVYIDNFSYEVYDIAEPQTFGNETIEGGDKPVLNTLSEVRITGDTYLTDDPTDYVTLSQRANDSDGDFVAATVPYFAYIEDSEIVVAFDGNLALGTTYKIEISGIQDEYFVAYNDYEFTFRTLNPGENPLPEVSLISPVANTRFYAGESTVTLSAEAVDTLEGTIAKVEFYAGDVLVGEATEGVDDVFTYEWALDYSFDSSEPIAITAKAIDNEGGDATSLPVNVVIWSKQAPEVTITSPEQNTLCYANIGGVDFEVKPTIEFEKSDIDGTIEGIKVYIDDNAGITVDPAATSYTLTEELTAGDHVITVEITDDTELVATDSVALTVAELGKSGYIFNDNYAAEDLVAQWSKTGNVTVANGSLTDYAEVEGIILSSTSGSVKRAIIRNLTDTAFVADVKLAFGDTTTKRTVKLGDKELATFTADGKITFGGTQKGTYVAGQTYNISAVVEAAAGKVYAIVDGTQIGSSSATYGVNPKILVSHEGSGETAIVTASASLIGVAVEPSVNVVDDKQITVDFAAGVDVSTLPGNVSVVDVATGKAVNLTYANGVFTINEILKYANDYEVVVLPDVRDVNGVGYSGTYKYAFTTAQPTTVGIADVVVSDAVLDAEGNFTATLDVPFNGPAQTKNVTLVCAAYNGTKMEAHQVIELSAPVTAEDIALSLSGVSEGAVIEAFVVENMTNLKAVSDKIFVIR